MKYRAIGHTIAPMTWLYECEGCGVAVSNKQAHDRDHAARDRTAQQADSADMWTRPIGADRGPYLEIDPASVVHLGNEID